MSPRLPRVAGAEVVRALGRAGWFVACQRGSHRSLRHPACSGTVVVAVHAGETLKPKTLQSILDQAGLTVEEFRELL